MVARISNVAISTVGEACALRLLRQRLRSPQVAYVLTETHDWAGSPPSALGVPRVISVAPLENRASPTSSGYYQTHREVATKLGVVNQNTQ